MKLYAVGLVFFIDFIQFHALGESLTAFCSSLPNAMGSGIEPSANLCHTALNSGQSRIEPENFGKDVRSTLTLGLYILKLSLL